MVRSRVLDNMLLGLKHAILFFLAFNELPDAATVVLIRAPA